MSEPRGPNPFVEAVVHNDAHASESGNAKEVVAHLGIDFDALHFVAEQRALRAVLLTTGRLKGLQQTADPINVRLSPVEQELMTFFKAAYLDALVIGWRARGIADDADADT